MLFECDRPLSKQRLIKEVNKFSLGSFEKANKLLGWSPEVSLKEGINKCVSYAKNLEKIVGEKK